MNADPLLGSQIGDFIIRELLGRGGMGRVYRAERRASGALVALKVIESEFERDPEHTERFKHEARSIFQLRHPNIVEFYEFGVFENLHYLAVEYICGPDLGWVLEDYRLHGELIRHEDAVQLIEQVALALDYIHSRGVVHRDVKPANILIDKKGRAVLTDFGMALSASKKTLGTAFGSAHFVAPEQATSSARAVSQSDLYSLGVILYEMLTGVLPFDGENAMSIALKHLGEPPPPPRSVNPDLHPAIEELLLRALAKNVQDRYQTGAAFVDALHAAMEVAQPAQRATINPILAASKGEKAERSDVSGAAAHRQTISPRSLLQVVEQKADLSNANASEPDISPRQVEGSRGSKGPLLAFGMAALLGILCAATGVATVRGAELIASWDQPAADHDALASDADVASQESTGAMPVATASGPPTEDPPRATPTPALPLTMATSALIPAELPAAAPNVQMVYDEAAVTVINIAGPSLSLAGITFKRVTPDGAYTAAFSASAWNRVAAYSVHALPPGDCYQLRRFGTPLSKPAACDSLQGWLATANQDWYFWIPGEGSSAFRVLRNGEAIQTCQISEGRCVFYLPQP